MYREEPLPSRTTRAARRASPLTAAFVLTLCACLLSAAAVVCAQEDRVRNLWDTAFGNSTNKPARSGKSQARRKYRVATPHIPPVGVARDAPVGVTVWRLRPAQPHDSGERLLVQESASAAAWVPERVSSTARLRDGDRVRVSIEAARAGYLYVIDREEYADGTLGEPYLIFPTARTLGGQNEVRAGRVVEIPAQDDSPPFFTLKRGSSRQVGELLSVIVTPAPLEGLRLTDGAQKLSAAQVAQWEKSWGANVGRLEMTGGEGQAWTREEKDAGADATRTLDADAPAPQTLFYRASAKPGDPVLIKFALKYRDPAPVKRRRG